MTREVGRRDFGPAARWALALGWLALIHLGSALSPPETKFFLPFGLDKVAHLCEFGLLGGLFWRPVREQFQRRPGIWAAALILAFLAMNAAVDEFHQSFVPGRTPSVWDAASDVLGGTLALGWMLHREKARPPF